MQKTYTRPSKEIIYKTPQREHLREDDDYDVEVVEVDAKKIWQIKRSLCS